MNGLVHRPTRSRPWPLHAGPHPLRVTARRDEVVSAVVMQEVHRGLPPFARVAALELEHAGAVHAHAHERERGHESVENVCREPSRTLVVLRQPDRFCQRAPASAAPRSLAVDAHEPLSRVVRWGNDHCNERRGGAWSVVFTRAVRWLSLLLLGAPIPGLRCGSLPRHYDGCRARLLGALVSATGAIPLARWDGPGMTRFVRERRRALRRSSTARTRPAAYAPSAVAGPAIAARSPQAAAP